MHGWLTDEPLPGDGRLLFAGTLEQWVDDLAYVGELASGTSSSTSTPPAARRAAQARGIAEPPGSTAVDTSAGSM